MNTLSGIKIEGEKCQVELFDGDDFSGDKRVWGMVDAKFSDGKCHHGPRDDHDFSDRAESIRIRFNHTYDVPDDCPIVTPPEQGLVSWFKSSDLGPGKFAGNAWASSVGKFTAHSIRGTVKTVTEKGHGAKRPVRMVTGSTASMYTFGPIILEHYTICSLSRYNGTARKRILQGTRSNWLHGHWSSKAGIAYYEGWLNGHSNRVNPLDNWVNMCGSSRALFLDGSGVVGQRDEHVSGNQGVVINTGKFHKEKSNWAVAEVMTWDRELSEEEMKTATTYLRQVLDGPCPDLSCGSVEAAAGVPVCQREDGQCIMADGSDQKDGRIKVGDVDDASEQAKVACLEKCLEYESTVKTGCEVAWDQGNGGCYVHTKAVSRGNKVAGYNCWIFEGDCAASTSNSSALVRAQRGMRVEGGKAFVPEVLYQGTYYPICGHYFWNSNNGASIVCKLLGFNRGLQRQTWNKFGVDAMPVGDCKPGEKLTQCTGGGNDWGNFDDRDGWCKKGKEVGVEVTCYCDGENAKSVSTGSVMGTFVLPDLLALSLVTIFGM